MDSLIRLAKLRKNIDKIDSDLVKIIAKRFKVAEKVMRLKRENNLPREDKNREDKVISEVRKLSSAYGVNPTLLESIIRLIIDDTKK